VSARDSLQAYRPDLAVALEAGGLPSYRFIQVYEHLMHRPLVAFAQATALPGGLRADLDARGVTTLREITRQEDSEGTTKILHEAVDGARLESVVMRYRARTTVCVSSQVGCALGCVFCATGSLGFRRDLTTAEILDQVRTAMAAAAAEGRRLTNVVFMGMGEPLLNLDNVLGALGLLHDPAGLNMARRSLSVSTVGIPKGIRRLAEAEPQVNLALSLHASDDTLRTRLMPVGRRYPLNEVLRAVEDHFARTHRKLFVEYLLLEGVNDSPQQAHALADLMRGRVVTVNLIPWNPACGGFRASPKEAVQSFRAILEARGVEAGVRLRRGHSVEGACGQLAAAQPGEPQTDGTRARPAAGGRSSAVSRPDQAGRAPRKKSPPRTRRRQGR